MTLADKFFQNLTFFVDLLQILNIFIFSSDDVNAHDMYIPTMGFITYILLAGWSLGSAGDFDPAKLGDIASAATGWLVLEVLLTLLSLFLLQVKV